MWFFVLLFGFISSSAYAQQSSFEAKLPPSSQLVDSISAYQKAVLGPGTAIQQGLIFQKLGLVQQEIGLYQQATTSLLSAARLLDATKHPRVHLAIENALARLYADAHKPDSAEKAYQRANKLAISLRDTLAQIQITSQLAWLEKGRGLYEQALFWGRHSLSLCRTKSDSLQAFWGLLALSEASKRIGKAYSAQTYAEVAWVLIKNQPPSHEKAKSALLLAQYYSALGNTSPAVWLMYVAGKVKDSLAIIESQHAAFAAEARFRLLSLNSNDTSKASSAPAATSQTTNDGFPYWKVLLGAFVITLLFLVASLAWGIRKSNRIRNQEALYKDLADNVKVSIIDPMALARLQVAANAKPGDILTETEDLLRKATTEAKEIKSKLEG